MCWEVSTHMTNYRLILFCNFWSSLTGLDFVYYCINSVESVEIEPFNRYNIEHV